MHFKKYFTLKGAFSRSNKYNMDKEYEDRLNYLMDDTKFMSKPEFFKLIHRQSPFYKYQFHLPKKLGNDYDSNKDYVKQYIKEFLDTERAPGMIYADYSGRKKKL